MSVNSLALVEISNSDDIAERYGVTLYGILYHDFVARLQSWVRSTDQGKSIGPNRYMAILRGVGSHAQLELAIAKLNRILAEPFEVVDEIIPVYIHTGFAIMQDEAVKPSDALRQATQALNRAKANNQAYMVHGEESGGNPNEEREMVAQVANALEQGELHIFYQPKFHAGYKNLVGAEALIRWLTKDKKIRMPDQFMPIVERHEAMRPLTWWMIKSVVARLARWPYNLSIAVNIPPPLLQDYQLYTVINDALTLHNVKPSRLVIEVTERIKADDQATVYQMLNRLKKIGIKISIDDFGTGFSSFSYFRNFPADELKIDKSFVSQMLQSKMDQTIVKSIIELAHNFSLKVVAEGVENTETADMLRSMGCDILQGYLFDKALPVEEFEMRYHLSAQAAVSPVTPS